MKRLLGVILLVFGILLVSPVYADDNWNTLSFNTSCKASPNLVAVAYFSNNSQIYFAGDEYMWYGSIGDNTYYKCFDSGTGSAKGMVEWGNYLFKGETTYIWRIDGSNNVINWYSAGGEHNPMVKDLDVRDNTNSLIVAGVNGIGGSSYWDFVYLDDPSDSSSYEGGSDTGEGQYSVKFIPEYSNRTFFGDDESNITYTTATSESEVAYAKLNSNSHQIAEIVWFNNSVWSVDSYNLYRGGTIKAAIPSCTINSAKGLEVFKDELYVACDGYVWIYNETGDSYTVSLNASSVAGLDFTELWAYGDEVLYAVGDASPYGYALYGEANLTVRAYDSISGDPILSFSTNVDGDDYTTTDGTVVTTIPRSDASVVALNVSATNYVLYEDAAYNVTANLNAQLQPLGAILNFNIASNGTEAYSSVVGNWSGTQYTNNNLSVGDVLKVIWNDYQLFRWEFTGSSITRNCLVETPDKAVKVRVISDGGGIEDAAIEVFRIVNNEWRLVYRELTDDNGYAWVLVEGNNLFKIEGSADGYTTDYITPYIYDSGEDTFIIDLSGTSNELNMVNSTCDTTIREDMICNIYVIGKSGTSSIMFNYTAEDGTNGTVTIYGSSGNMNFNVNNDTGDYEIEIWVDGELSRKYYYDYERVNERSFQIVPSTALINDDKGFFIFMVIFAALIIGVAVESKFRRQGFRVFALVISAFAIFIPILWVLTAIWAIYEIYMIYRRLGD